MQIFMGSIIFVAKRIPLLNVEKLMDQMEIKAVISFAPINLQPQILHLDHVHKRNLFVEQQQQMLLQSLHSIINQLLQPQFQQIWKLRLRQTHCKRMKNAHM